MTTSEARDTSETVVDTVAVAVCTFRRPDELTRLLSRLVDVAAHATGAARVGVVVVDDDPSGSAKAVVEAFVDRFELGLAYVESGAGNISVARNLALRTGIATGAWLALVDDDCLPDVEWVTELLAAARRGDAQCVSGACVDEPPAGAPGWLVDEPFLDGHTEGVDGAPIDIGALKNTLVSARFLADHDIEFDPDYGLAGGEDVMFFRCLHRAGVHHVFAAHAVVRERVPLERSTLRYQLGRRFWYGNTEAVTSLASDRSTRLRTALRGTRSAAAGLARPAVRLARGESPQLRYAASEVLRGAGRVLGAAGIKVRHR